MATKVVVPELGESVVEATVGAWLKQVGDVVNVGDVLVELQTDKVDLEVGAEASGVLSKIERPEGEDVAIGDVLGVIDEDAARPTSSAADSTATPAEEKGAPAVAKAAEPAPATESAQKEKATPVARRVAAAEGVALDAVDGSGRAGRVTREDVEQFLSKKAQPAPKAASAASASSSAPGTAPAADPRQERVKMSRRRRTIARRLVEAQQTAALLTTFNEVDMTAVMEIRRRRRESFQERFGVKLGFTSFFVKASVAALKAFPRLNAEIDGDEMVVKHFYDIGIAVGAEEGLVVPVLRDADRQSFAEIEQNVRDYAQKVRNGSLSLADLQGGTFTITNGGVFGSMLSTPIINPPQVAILGLHNIVERPMAVDGAVHIRPIMYMALTYDHRIVDGREAVQFLVRVKHLIEDPESLLLAG